MVGIVIVSHSWKIAEGIKDLTDQIASAHKGIICAGLKIFATIDVESLNSAHSLQNVRTVIRKVLQSVIDDLKNKRIDFECNDLTRISRDVTFNNGIGAWSDCCATSMIRPSWNCSRRLFSASVSPSV